MIKEYINEVLASLHPQFKHLSHEIIFECESEFEVNSFPGAISQIMTNLLMNSLNHGFENIEKGHIYISICRNDQDVIINYRDTGCGMNKENLRKIFEPFFTTKRGKGGSGLGMHIVYNLVTQTLKGTINATSAVGEGVTFKLAFPCDLNSDRKQIINWQI